ncbi:Apoptosis-inducing factor 2 [Seminavis robusta]|uniref:Apoptosis-inducing factor 2 n=1 Tax=Seminavis robusta TaxID=568900 RepID=A0A9N8ERT3_9STRA|nr:Apoptosis-inducing factor 2 [Seminavis robusta]|eukprot:Sro1769_g296500.1 Apoptosis-inducing factor 2 (764) ;mRNA; f:17169-19460
MTTCNGNDINKYQRMDVYDIDGTLTRPGYDLWYLTSKALAKDAKDFDARVKEWKQEVADTGEVVKSSGTMMQDTIGRLLRDDFATGQVVQDMARSIVEELIQKGIVFSEWLAFVKERLQEGVTPVLATTNYIEGARAFLEALVRAKWLTQAEADRFVCSGTVVDWKNRTLLHFNINMGKAKGVSEATGISDMEAIHQAVENVFGDDPMGNDYGILTMTNHHAWVVNTQKNATKALPLGMQRMSWLHWTDQAKHRVPRGLMGVFGGKSGDNDERPSKRLQVDTSNIPLLDTHASSGGKPNIVVVGGGFCGVLVTSMLQENNDLSITLIDPKDSFEYVGALPKTLVQYNTQSDKKATSPAVSLPFHQILGKQSAARHVRAWVDQVEEKHVVVQFASGMNDPGAYYTRKIPFDHLVLATGSTYPAGIKHSHMTAVHGITRGVELQRQQQRVANAESILLIGGGYVAAEIATEVATAYPGKQITMVDRHPRLLSRIPEAHDMLLQRLTELKINVVLGETITSVDPQSLDYVSASGRRFSTDHAIWTGGPQPNTAGLVGSIETTFPQAAAHHHQSATSSRGCIVVDHFLSLPGSGRRVWSGGDACILDDGVGEEAMAARAMHQGRVIANNILAAVQAGIGARDSALASKKGELELTKYVHDKASIASMIVSLGGDSAMVIIGDVPVVGPFRCLKEEVERLLLVQLEARNETQQSLVDPYNLLKSVNVEKLRELAASSTKGKEHSIADILPPEQKASILHLLVAPSQDS